MRDTPRPRRVARPKAPIGLPLIALLLLLTFTGVASARDRARAHRRSALELGLSGSGETPRWRRVGTRGVYRVLIKAPDGRKIVTVKDATTYTPQALPGGTVSYR